MKAPLEHMNTDGHRPASVLLDAAQAAAYLGVSRQFLRQASLSGEVAYVDLRDVEGLTIPVIAEKLEVSQATLYRRLPARPATAPTASGAAPER